MFVGLTLAPLHEVSVSIDTTQPASAPRWLAIGFWILRRFSALEWPERVLFPLGAVVGITTYAMSRYSIGGQVERNAVLFYNALFFFSLVRAWLYRARREALLKRRWLLRAVGVLLGIATTRPVMGVFFATSPLTHLSLQQFFGITFCMGFSINWIVVESWLRLQPSS